jgi:DNA-binding protein HU-beta
MTLSTSQMVKRVYENHRGELPKRCVQSVINDFLDQVYNGMISRDIVRLDCIGIFKIKPCAARKGRNPRTGGIVNIPPRNKVAFQAAKCVRDEVAPKRRGR